jgi:hypothetical protein
MLRIKTTACLNNLDVKENSADEIVLLYKYILTNNEKENSTARERGIG